MSDSIQRPKAPQAAPELDLTRSIRKLSLPTAQSDDLGVTKDNKRRCALLVCRDSESRKWGPRWLKQAGLDPVVADPDMAIEEAINLEPDVIIVDAGLQNRSKSPLYQTLQDATAVKAPVIVLCSGSKDLYAALNAGVFDVVRKPFEWDLISRRATRAADVERNGDRTRRRKMRTDRSR